MNPFSTRYEFGNFSRKLKSDLLEQKAIILIDENVAKKHKNKIEGFKIILIPAGEQHKNQETVTKIYEQLIAYEADRSTLLVGIGGGVTTDITGFVASTYMRGLKFGFVPSTLLAQVDASIGGKNGIDHLAYKNIIGTINQPEFIFFDTDFLSSLPQNEWINGCAEIIKHACIKDKTLFALLQQGSLNKLQTDKQFLNDIIQQNVAIKKKVIEEDPFEKGERKKLNFGHTFGHAIENTYQLSHGNAVAIGMVVATQLSQQIGHLSPEKVEAISQLIVQYQLPISYPFELEKIFHILKLDKKRTREFIHFILLKDIGEATIESIKISDLQQLLKTISF